MIAEKHILCCNISVKHQDNTTYPPIHTNNQDKVCMVYEYILIQYFSTKDSRTFSHNKK